MKSERNLLATLLIALAAVGCGESTPKTQQASPNQNPSPEVVSPQVSLTAAPNATSGAAAAAGLVGKLDWNQWGGGPSRNNTPEGKYIPDFWKISRADFDNEQNWKAGAGKNIKWAAKLGSQTYGNPVVANGQVYVGTNNGAGWIKKYPAEVDLGCLLCFRESDGAFLWQHSNEKLPQGRVQDWEQQGVCATVLVEGDRLWYISNRGVVVCLDTQGFHDGENDGPYKDEPADLQTKSDADVVWQFDMIAKLGLFQHNMCASSVTAAGDLLFVITGNGVDESHVNIPAPDCPSFVCLNKKTGEYYWGDKSPGLNILHGQWSSPAYGVLGGVPQVMFAGGDSWVYSFKADQGSGGKPTLLWKFDCNPKKSKWIIGGRGTRNEVISTPVIYKDRVYVCVGQDPEHGEGEGHLWCIDPTKKLDGSDVSPELVVDENNKPVPHRRLQAALDTDRVIPNPNSAAIWHYSKFDQNGDGSYDFEEELHRSIGTVAIKDDILFLADFSGVFHCLDAMTGKVHWSYDMLAASWGSALIVDNKVYIGDEDGDLAVFRLSAKKEEAMKKNEKGEWKPLQEINMLTSVYSTPVVANNVLFISTKTHLFAISADGK
jgi:outer membrane protein assembly factor BamB